MYRVISGQEFWLMKLWIVFMIETKYWWSSSLFFYSLAFFFLNMIKSSDDFLFLSNVMSLSLLGSLLYSERTRLCWGWWLNLSFLTGFVVYLNISYQLILLKWSFTKHLLIKFSSCWEIGFISRFIDIYWWSSTFISFAIELYSKGQKPNAISYVTTPKLQISAFIVYISPFSTSGAI